LWLDNNCSLNWLLERLKFVTYCTKTGKLVDLRIDRVTHFAGIKIMQ